MIENLFILLKLILNLKFKNKYINIYSNNFLLIMRRSYRIYRAIMP